MKKFAIALAVVASLGMFVGTASADHKHHRHHNHRHHDHHHGWKYNRYDDCGPGVRYYAPAPYYRTVPVYPYGGYNGNGNGYYGNGNGYYRNGNGYYGNGNGYHGNGNGYYDRPSVGFGLSLPNFSFYYRK